MIDAEGGSSGSWVKIYGVVQAGQDAGVFTYAVHA
jgi:hypothetical protein